MSGPPLEKENRRIQRIALPLPVRVEVRVDKSYAWNEITRLSDISAYGAGFTLKRPVRRGRLVLLTVPMPRQLRSYDYGEPQYRVWGLVRRCISLGRNAQAAEFAIGVAFIGKNPPQDYLENPGRLYDTSNREGGGFWLLSEASNMRDEGDRPNELRRQTRFFIPEALTLEVMDEAGNVIKSETTVTENLSLSGAAVFTTLDIEAGGFMRVSSERHNVKIISVIRGKSVGADGITRLHLEFIDRFFPLEGIESDQENVSF